MPSKIISLRPRKWHHRPIFLPLKRLLVKHPHLYMLVKILHYIKFSGRRTTAKLLRGTRRFTWNGVLVSTSSGLPSPDQIRRVTLVPYRGVGDALMMTPTARFLKFVKPEIQIEMVVPQAYQPLFERLNEFDSLISVECDDRSTQDYETAAVDKLKNRLAGDSIFFTLSPRIQRNVRGMIQTGEGGGNPFMLGSALIQESMDHCDAVASLSQATYFSWPMFLGRYLGIDPFLAVFGGQEQASQFIKKDHGMLSISPNISDVRQMAMFYTRLIDTFGAPKDIIKKGYLYVNLMSSNYGKNLDIETELKIIRGLARRFSDRYITVNAGTEALLRNHPNQFTERQYMDACIRPRLKDLENIYIPPAMNLVDAARLMGSSQFFFTVDTGVGHIFATPPFRHIPGMVVFGNKITAGWSIPRPGLKVIWPSHQEVLRMDKSQPLRFEAGEDVSGQVLAWALRQLGE